ncbi:hypothetical protein [Pontivivens insulae]|uniref:Uncharacterized protein n=1 Tax=Pontivivens insulae TaxID=1639689 RepID=A0A2R8AAP9_9RHOB|nr:hypothetical protein [Pontivivens insulae]RED13187.1 hypothetical protein DFR53_2323 [Pontivivens insulae]SPF29279.1 hypothetical protein POI8812_01587 [Pontivivens insulae]
MSATDRMAEQLAAARTAVDAEFGEGYAAAHPELVAACVQSAAIHTAVIIGKQASEETNKTLLQLKPRLFG